MKDYSGYIYKGSNISVKQIQEVQIELLKEFQRICDAHELNYQLFAGSLLGAVRHKGFIPWDDDIDLCMPRNDYERFMQVCKEDLKEDYFLQHAKSDSSSILQFSKLRKNETIFSSLFDEGSGMHQGIFIDIFPLDSVNPSSLLGRLQPWVINFFFIVNSSRLFGRVKHTKNTMIRFVRFFLHIVVRFIPKSFFDTVLYTLFTFYNKKDTPYMNHLTNGITTKRLKMYLRDKDSFKSSILLPFEGLMVPCPINYHELLTQNFGDYMKLPEESKRKPHHQITKIRIK